MAGVGESGVWQTGVWVTPLDFEGDFALLATAELEYTGRFAFGKPFNLVASGDLLFDGAVVAFGEFDLDGASDLGFIGQFVPNPGQGLFSLTGTADVSFAWVPKLAFPGSEVGIPDDPADVIIKTKPGDVITIGGMSGTVTIDAEGRLVVIDQTASHLSPVVFQATTTANLSPPQPS